MTRARGRSAASATVLAAARHARVGLTGALTGRAPRPGWASPGSRGRWAVPPRLAVATAALAVLNATSVHGGATGGGAASQVFGRLAAVAVVAAPLLLAARDPLLAWRTGVLTLLVTPLLLSVTWWGGWPWGPAQILALLVVFCLVGINQPRAVLWTMWALTLLPWWLWLAARLPNLDGPIGATLIFTSVTVALDSMSSGLLARRSLAVETGRANAERSRRAVLEERTRIARELHDVVAHHMSLIAVRAETAGYRLTDVPESALAEFGSLSQLARETLADMRRLLGVLREDLPTGLEPQPQLSDLPALVDAARQAGVEVSLTSSGTGTAAGLPDSVSLCAYRIVQESLSNASQHAAGATVSICVDQDDDAIRLRITNGPSPVPTGASPVPAGPSPVPTGTSPVPAGLSPVSALTPTAADCPASELRPGHGLTGMRERVALLGGSLTAGPVPAGGFAVTAVLPLSEAA